MIYVGVDIGKAAHYIAAIDDQGKVVLKPLRITQDAEGYRRLAEALRALGEKKEVVVGIEATGHYWVLLVEELRRLGYEARVFNPILSGEATRRTVRGRKSDEDDALLIAKVVRDGGFVPMPLPTTDQSYAKQLARYRQRTVARSANAQKRLQKCLDLVFPEFSQLFSDPSCPSSLEMLHQAPSARQMASLKTSTVTKILEKSSRNHLGSERAHDIIAAAKTSIAVERTDLASEFAVHKVVEEIRLLEEQIVSYDAELAKIKLPGKELVDSIPGIGPVLATVIVAEIVTIDRFTGTDPRRELRKCSRGCNGFHRLIAFAGMDARICESGEWKGTRRISKRGSTYLRAALYQAANVARRDDAFKDTWERHRLTMKQPHKVACCHIARKVLQAVYGVLKNNTPFDAIKFKGAA